MGAGPRDAVGAAGAHVLMRRFGALLVLLLAALALAACGGGSGSDASDEPATTAAAETSVLAAAAESAADSGSSKLSLTLTTQIPEQEAPVAITGEGEFDYEARVGRFTYDFSDLLGSLGSDAESGSAEIIIDGNVFYMNFPLLSGLVPGAKDWIKFDLATLGEQQGIDLSQFGQVGQSDPAATLDYLRATANVEEAGTEEIRGVETTHYTGVVDLDKTVQLAPADSRDEVQATIDQLEEQIGTSELPVEVWIDPDGLPARLRYEVSVSADGSDTTTVVVMDFFDWGADVVVEPPPADEVTDIAELTSTVNAASETTDCASSGLDYC
jgi:hypothetical protein